MNVVGSESRVIIETTARGLLAAAAHDLRIEAPIASGESADGVHCTARFSVAAMKVHESRRHGTSEWHDPNERDARDIEGRIRSEAFPGLKEIVVEGELDGTKGKLTVRAARTQRVDVPVRVERSGDKTTVHGKCDLSLEALGTGRIHVPLGAIKLEDRVVVTFDVVLQG
jgi:hypothetical protein